MATRGNRRTASSSTSSSSASRDSFMFGRSSRIAAPQWSSSPSTPPRSTDSARNLQRWSRRPQPDPGRTNNGRHGAHGSEVARMSHSSSRRCTSALVGVSSVCRNGPFRWSVLAGMGCGRERLRSLKTSLGKRIARRVRFNDLTAGPRTRSNEPARNTPTVGRPGMSPSGGNATLVRWSKPQNQGSIEQVKQPIPYMRTRRACVCGCVRDRTIIRYQGRFHVVVRITPMSIHASAA